MKSFQKKSSNADLNDYVQLPEVIFTLYWKAGGDCAYERGGDASRKFWIKLLKETDLGVAQAFFDP